MQWGIDEKNSIWTFERRLSAAEKPRAQEPWGEEPWAQEPWVQTLYRLALPDIRQDKTVLDFGKIDDALVAAVRIDNSAQHLQETQATRERMTGAIRACQSRDPTPAGLLDLRRALLNIWEEVPKDSGDRMVAADICFNVNVAISETLPQATSLVVDGIDAARDELNAIARTLEEDPQADIDEALSELRLTLGLRVALLHFRYDELLARYLMGANIPYLTERLVQRAIEAIVKPSWTGRVQGFLVRLIYWRRLTAFKKAIGA